MEKPFTYLIRIKPKATKQKMQMRERNKIDDRMEVFSLYSLFCWYSLISLWSP